MRQSIRIFVDTERRGNISYEPAVCHVERGDTILWRANGNLAIQFKGETPIGKFRPGNGMSELAARVRNDAPPGVYHYAVAVAVENKLFLDSGCPTIIIRVDDDSGGGDPLGE